MQTMEKCWVICMVIGLFVGIATAQADYEFYDAIANDAKNIETNIQNDAVIEQSDTANDDIKNYNIDQIINSALAEGLNNDDFEANDSNVSDEVAQNVDENQENQDGNVNYDENQNAEPENQENDDGKANSDEERINAEIDIFKQILAGEAEVDNEELNEEDANGNLDDYQFEDNRSEAKEARNDLPSDSDGNFDNFENQDSVENNLEQEERVDFPDPIAENQDIFEETKQILKEPENVNEFVVDEEQNVDDGGFINQIQEVLNQKLQESSDEESQRVDENVEINDQFDPEENMNNDNVPVGSENMNNEQVSDEQVQNEPVSDEQFSDEQVQNEQVSDEQVQNEQMPDEQVQNEPVSVEQISDEKTQNEPVSDEQVQIEDTLHDENQEDASNNYYDHVDYEHSPEEEFVDYFDGHEAEAAENEDENLVNEDEAVESPIDNIEQQFDAQSDEDNKDYESHDTVDKVQADLDRDIQHLFETWSKLSQNSDEIPEQNFDNGAVEGNVEEYEQKYGKPYGEDNVLSQRDYANDEIDQIVDDPEDTDEGVLTDNVDVPDENNVEPNVPETDIDENVFFGVSKLINAGEDVSNEDDKVEHVEIVKNNVSSDTKVETPENYQIVGESAKNVPEKTNVEIQINTVPEQKSANIVLENTDDQQETTIKSIDVSELTSTQYDALMEQFAIVHLADMDPQSEDFAKHVAPIHIALGVDEATVVTSPNYPEVYPTNNIIDWIFDGEGMGIEFSITDLELNGALGDYLLIKPGSLDESGNEGLIFSFHLTEPRQYRFLDVDRMFVRFQSNPALAGFHKGFSFSVKMVVPIPEEELSPFPSPEPLLPPPATLTVYLGGMTLADFQEIKEDFRTVVADMATLYVNTHGVNPGVNTTLEVTQITSVGTCNVKWPNFENCVEVTFGVPLTYADDGDNDEDQRLTGADLADMWGSLFYVDPFAYRLSRMGIEEFSSPNEGAVLTAWLVIGGGVLISAAMLAFALWRFSCFEDYTRMAQFSDTDSIRSEKRGLDLYPTPHQTLPPLYSQEYKWVDDDVKVDMGGFTNKSYARDDLFDIDSDDDGSVPRDRYTSDV